MTGANQGGKSTFLRSVGVAQLLLQAGVFVAAQEFRAALVPGVHTHFPAGEDPAMTGGRLDEELARIGVLADRAGPGALLLSNESFASTNEREGSDLAFDVVRALTDAGVRVVAVTHLYEFARRVLADRPDRCLALRAGRDRSFVLTPGEPTPQAHGADLYRRILGGA